MHELANHRGHTALLIGGAFAQNPELARLEEDVQARERTGVIDAAIVVSAIPSEERAYARLESGAAAQLGVGGVTLLVMRPDGHVGLRADRRHGEVLAAYLEKLCDFPAENELRI